ncbi:MAG TPA: tetratricopeptide repeat protein, partial [Pyrinomonadaceae bacterium]|nr:tetratricopeptide repeat protein [Pyrinomonadaceae bacterium]
MTDERDKKETMRGEVSAPATSIKKGAPLESYAPFASIDATAFRQKLSTDNPALGALLMADKAGRARILAGMNKQSRQAIFAALISLTFQFKKRSQHSEALELARINYEVAASDPADQVDSFLDHTQPRNVGDALNTIGRIQNEMGDYSQALSTSLEAEARYQDDERLRKQAGITKPSKMDLAFNLVDFRSENFAFIAEIHKQLGDIQAAEEYFAKAWQFSQRGADPQSRFEQKISAADAARARGDLNLALGEYLEALKLALDLPSSIITGKDVVQPLAAMGMIYADLGLNRRALELFERTRRINERSSHLGRLLRDHANIAEVYAARGETQAAIASYRRALVCASRELIRSPSPTALIWQEGDKTYQLVQLESAWRILLALARLERTQNPHIALGQLELAVSVIEHLRTRVVQEERRVSYQAPSMEVYDELVDQLAEQYERTNDHAYVDKLFSTIERAKARVLYEMLADQPIAKPPRTPDELIAQETLLLQVIEKLQKSLDGTDGLSFEKIDQLDAANQSLSQVWEQIASSDPDEGPEYVSLRKAEVVSCDDIRETLRDSGNLRVVVANYYVAKKRLIVVGLYSDKPDLSYHSVTIDRDEVR